MYVCVEPVMFVEVEVLFSGGNSTYIFFCHQAIIAASVLQPELNLT